MDLGLQLKIVTTYAFMQVYIYFAMSSYVKN